MTLDELANLVRKTAKELDLTLDKVCVFHGNRTMDFRTKKPPKETEVPHVYCELVNGMNVGRVSFALTDFQDPLDNPTDSRDRVRYYLKREAQMIGSTPKGLCA